jgi:hypothetical protein
MTRRPAVAAEAGAGVLRVARVVRVARAVRVSVTTLSWTDR